jgi:HK97 gp10 family phage protein
MARVANWRDKEVFARIEETAIRNGNEFMDEVVAEAKRRCPIGDETRPGGFTDATVEFTPRTGRNKGKLVKFGTHKRWKGRFPGQLQSTIRRTNKAGASTIRVYAGNFKVYYARFVEKGTVKMRKKPFLRPAFDGKKRQALKRVQGIG